MVVEVKKIMFMPVLDMGIDMLEEEESVGMDMSGIVEAIVCSKGVCSAESVVRPPGLVDEMWSWGGDGEVDDFLE